MAVPRSANALFVVALGAAAQGGCAPFKETTYEMRVVDPTRVSIARNGRTLVPEGAPFPPRPMLERDGVVYHAERDSRGALRAEFPSSTVFFGPSWSSLVSSSGELTPDIRDRGFQLGAVVQAPVCHLWGRHGCFEAIELLTPRDNVSLLVKTIAPSRTTGILLLATALSFSAIGTAFLVANDDPKAKGADDGRVIGGLILAHGVACLGWAGWYLFAPSLREELVGGAGK